MSRVQAGVRRIQAQQVNSHTPSRGQCHDSCSSQGEMLTPRLDPWIEEQNSFFGDPITRSEISSLEAVTCSARIGQIFACGLTAMFDRYDMVNLIRVGTVIFV